MKPNMNPSKCLKEVLKHKGYGRHGFMESLLDCSPLHRCYVVCIHPRQANSAAHHYCNAIDRFIALYSQMACSFPPPSYTVRVNPSDQGCPWLNPPLSPIYTGYDLLHAHWWEHSPRPRCKSWPLVTLAWLQSILAIFYLVVFSLDHAGRQGQTICPTQDDG